MTSPGRRESAETVLAYSGGVIDRAANQRTEPGWVDATLGSSGTRLIPMWRDQCVVSGEPAVPVIVPAATAAAGAVLNSAAEGVFLRLDDHGGVFSAALSQAGESAAALLRQLRVPDPHRPRRAPQDVPERGVRAPCT